LPFASAVEGISGGACWCIIAVSARGLCKVLAPRFVRVSEEEKGETDEGREVNGRELKSGEQRREKKERLKTRHQQIIPVADCFRHSSEENSLAGKRNEIFVLKDIQEKQQAFFVSFFLLPLLSRTNEVEI